MTVFDGTAKAVRLQLRQGTALHEDATRDF